MLRRYELTDQEWEQVAFLLPPEKTGKLGRPSKDNRTMLNGMVWIARSGAPLARPSGTLWSLEFCIHPFPQVD